MSRDSNCTKHSSPVPSPGKLTNGTRWSRLVGGTQDREPQKMRALSPNGLPNAQLRSDSGCRSLLNQVGLEPTTLRLTARHLSDSALLRIALCSAFPDVYASHPLRNRCGYRPQLLAIFIQSTHKSPHSPANGNPTTTRAGRFPAAVETTILIASATS